MSSEDEAEILEFFGAKEKPKAPTPADIEKEVERDIEESLREYDRLGKLIAKAEEDKEILKEKLLKKLAAESMKDKAIEMHSYGSVDAVITRIPGRTSIKWEKYVEDHMTGEAVKEVEAIRRMVKSGEGTSPYITRGGPSFKIAVVERKK